MATEKKQKIKSDDTVMTASEVSAEQENTIPQVQDQPMQTSTPVQDQQPKEGMMFISDVKKLINEALAEQAKQANKPLRPKKVTEHHVHVWRLDGKWVIDFVDQNINKETGKKIDEYKKSRVHSWNKFNEQKREFEAWIELQFNDGSTKPIPLVTYLQNRSLVYCPILKREKIDQTYSVGEVEKKKEMGDRLVGTGVMVDQIVERYDEVFHLKTPEGQTLVINDYALA